MNDITEVDRLNAKIADLNRTIEWLQGRIGITMGVVARDEIAAQPAPVSGAVVARPDLIALLVDRDTPPDNRNEVIDHDINGNPITRGDIAAFVPQAPDAPVAPEVSDDEWSVMMHGPKSIIKREDWDPVTRRPKVAATLPAAPAPTELPPMPDHPISVWTLAEVRVIEDYARAAIAAQQATDHCAMCNNTGIVGRAPDDYFDCPDCVAARQAPDSRDAADAARWRYVRDTETLETAVWEALEGTDCAPGGVFDRAAYAAGMDRAVDAAITQEKS